MFQKALRGISGTLSFLTAQKLLTVVVLTGLVVPAVAQHPYLWLDATELTLMQDKVASGAPDWLALKAQCDLIAQYAVQYPHATNGGSSLTRGYVYNPPKAKGAITTGFNGMGWDAAMDQLGVCYQAIKSSDPATANTYLTQAHNVITAMSQPLLKLVRQSDGMTRYAVSADASGNDLLAGAPLQVLIPFNTAITVGDVWTISGATGCTSMNGTWKISSKTAPWSVFFSKTDGAPAPPLNANCTLYSVSIVDSFPAREYMPAIAKAYDWFNDGLMKNYPSDIANLTSAMTAWAAELSYCTGHMQPEDNYHAGYIWALTAGYVVFSGDDVSLGTLLNNTLANDLTAAHQFRDYNNQWLGGGGNGEGLQAYGYDSIRRVLNAEFALKIAGTDWSQPPVAFNMLDDTLQYFMEFTTPTKLSLDDNEYVFPMGSGYVRGSYTGQWFPTEAVYIPLGDATMYAAMARRFNSRYAEVFQGWYDSVYSAEQNAAGTLVPVWSSGLYQSQPRLADYFLWHDAEAVSSDWTVSPLMYRAWGGNYVVTRTDWSDTATEVTLLGGPSVGAAGNGKTQFDSGAITIQAGNNRLLVYGLGEASRAADLINSSQHTLLHNERGTYGNKKNSIFWAGANSAETRNQGLTSHTPPPGQVNTVESWPSSIDLAEDTTTYTYFRANHLEANNAKSSVDCKYHQVAWTRELVFLRPKLVIVHDRTTVLNNADDRAMFWTFGRNIAHVLAGVPSGMTRYDASFKGAYRGAFWSVLPAAANVTIVDHDNLHFLYRAEVRPATMNHTADNWLAVFDAASSSAEVNTVTSVTATNADAIQFNDADSSIIAFADLDPHVNSSAALRWPVNGAVAHYIVGLTPGASYGISVSGGNLTVSSSGAYQASAAGVLVYGK